MFKKARTALAVIMMLMLAATAFATGNDEQSSGTDGFEGVTARVFHVAIDEQTEDLLHSLEGDLGFQLEILTASWDQFAQKVNTMIATGVEVDLITCEESMPWRAWAQDGLIMPLDDMIDPEVHPYIESVTNAELYDGYRVDGNRYFLPNAHHGSDQGLVVRADIMEALGVDQIDDMDEYYDVMVRANEEFGVYGFVMALEDGLMKLQGATHIFAAFGGGGFIPQSRSFHITDGVVEDKSISSGTKDALTFLNRLYREGLMNRDYSTIRSGLASTYLETAQTFSVFSPPVSSTGWNDKMTAIDPSYAYTTHPAVDADNPDFYPITNGFNMWQISFVPETAENPEAALAYLEYLSSPAGRERLVAGYPGVTYTDAGFTEDGVFEPIPEGLEAQFGSASAAPRWWGLGQTVYGYIPVREFPSYEDAYANRVIYTKSEDATSGNPLSLSRIIEVCAPYSGYNAVSEVPLPIETEVRSNLNNIKGEYWNKIILAEDPAEIDDLWDEYVREWRAGGGDAYVAAYQEFYDSLQ